MSGDGARVEAAPRLAQWRVDALPCYTYRKSDPFRIGLWNWVQTAGTSVICFNRHELNLARRYLSVERNNKQTCVKLFAELSNSAKNTAPAPIASFVTKLLISFPPNQNTIVHPGIFDKQLKHDGFVWAIDSTVTGRFVIEIEFLDLKVADPSGGEPASIWASQQIKQSSDNTALSALARMLQEGILADITINAGGGSVGAHRAVLAARSPVFRSMFSHDLREKELSAVDVPDMPLDACRAFLGYLYGGGCEEFLAHRLALLGAADKYDVADLRAACGESLAEDIDAGNVLERLQAAHLYRLQELKGSCIRFLVDFRKVYELHDDLSSFLLTADRELVAEVFQGVLAAWNGR